MAGNISLRISQLRRPPRIGNNYLQLNGHEKDYIKNVKVFVNFKQTNNFLFMFSQADLFQIQQKGITLDQVNQQLEYFKKGFPYLKLIKPAIRNDGVITLNEQEKEQLIAEFETQKPNKKLKCW